MVILIAFKCFYLFEFFFHSFQRQMKIALWPLIEFLQGGRLSDVQRNLNQFSVQVLLITKKFFSERKMSKKIDTEAQILL